MLMSWGVVMLQLVLTILGWVAWSPNRREPAELAHNARVEATQPSPETSQLMCIVLGLGAIARTSAADALMLGFSGATVRDSDAQSPTRGEPAPPMLIMLMFYVWFRGHPTIARTSTADGHYTRLGRRVP